MDLLTSKKRFLGVDLGVSSVKVIELSRSGQRFKVEAIAIEPFPEGAIADRNPSDLDQVGAVIKRAFKASKSRLKNAATAVPTSSVITRTIPMPVEFGEEEIEANIQLDASQYIPFPLEEIHLDFQPQGTSKTDPGSQNVMLVASRQENVDLRREVLQEAGLKTMIVDVEAYALENSFQLLSQSILKKQSDQKSADASRLSPNKQISSGLNAVVDIGARITTLYILQGGKVVFTREQNFGGDQLTAAISEAYDMPKDKAELAKRSGELPEDYQFNILEPFRQSAAEQINQALQFFFASDHYSANRYNRVDSIVLVGGGALVPGIDIIATDRLGIPTLVGNPFAHMGNATRVNRHNLLRDAPRFAIACGLALRSFD